MRYTCYLSIILLHLRVHNGYRVNNHKALLVLPPECTVVAHWCSPAVAEWRIFVARRCSGPPCSSCHVPYLPGFVPSSSSPLVPPAVLLMCCLCLQHLALLLLLHLSCSFFQCVPSFCSFSVLPISNPLCFSHPDITSCLTSHSSSQPLLFHKHHHAALAVAAAPQA